MVHCQVDWGGSGSPTVTRCFDVRLPEDDVGYLTNPAADRASKFSDMTDFLDDMPDDYDDDEWEPDPPYRPVFLETSGVATYRLKGLSPAPKFS